MIEEYEYYEGYAPMQIWDRQSLLREAFVWQVEQNRMMSEACENLDLRPEAK